MPTIAGRPVHQVRIGRPGPSGPPGPTALGVVVVTAAAVTLDATHRGKMVILNSASAQTVTVPTGIWPAGEMAVFHRYGAGSVEFLAGSGALIESEGGLRQIAVQHGEASLLFAGPSLAGGNVYLLAGRLG